MTMHEAILHALANLISADGYFPSVSIDEPEPSAWGDVVGWTLATHSVAVQGGPVEELAFVRGSEPSSELELEAAIAYAVQVKPAPGQTTQDVRANRRRLRDVGARRIADIIAANPNLGLGHEVWATLGPPQRDDDVTFANAVPNATAITPVSVLYTGTDAAA